MAPTTFRRLCLSFLALASLLISATPSGAGPLPERVVLSERATSTLRVFNADAMFTGAVNAIPPTAGVQPIRTGSTPQETVASPNGRIAFVANFNSGYISVVDLVIGAEIRRIPGILARSVAINADGTRLVATTANDTLQVIDTQTFAVTPVSLPAGTNPQQVVVSGNRAYVNARGFVSPQAVVVVDLVTLSASPVSGTSIGFGPPKGGAMTTPDGRVLILRGVGTVYTLLVIDPATGDSVRVFNLPFVTYAIVSSNTRTFLLHRAGGAYAAGIAQIDPGAVSAPAPGQATVLANTPLTFLPVTTPFASNGMFQMALSADASRLVVVGADYGLSPKITTWDVNQLLTVPATTTPVKAFDLQHMIRDVHFIPAVANPYPVAQPTITGACAPATALVPCPKTVTNDVATTIRITGTGFTSGAVVRVGNSAPLVATVLSGTQMNVALPAGLAAQAAKIVVTLPGSSVADQHISNASPVFDQFNKPIVIVSPASYAPMHQLLVANFGDSSISILNSATNQSVSDPLTDAWVQPISVAMGADAEFAYVLSFAPAMLHRRTILFHEDRPPFSRLGPVSGQLGALELRPDNGILPGPAAFAWAMFADPVNGNVPMLSIHQMASGVPILQRQKMNVPAQSLLALTVDPQGDYAYGVSVMGNPGSTFGQMNVFTISGIPATDPVPATVTSFTLASRNLAQAQVNLRISPDGNTLAAAAATGGIQLLDITARTSPTPLGPPIAVDVAALAGAVPAGTSLSFNDYPIVDVPGVGRRVYGWDPGNLVLEIFDPVNPGAALGAVKVPGANSLATSILVTPDGRLAYVAIADEDVVAVIDLSRANRSGSIGAVLTKIRTGLSPLGLALRPGTPVGIGATAVTLTGDPTGGIGGGGYTTVVSFPGGVTSPGTLTVTTTNRNPNPVPAGFSLGSVPLYFEITASDGLAFNGLATVCFPYDPVNWGDPFKLIIQHFVGGVWVPQPTTIDFEHVRVCTQVSSFSPFTYGVYDTSFLTTDLQSMIEALIGNQGLINSLTVKAEHALDALDAQAIDDVKDALMALRSQVTAQAGKKLLTAEQATTLTERIDLILSTL